MEPLSREHIKDLRMCGELMGAYLRQIRDLEAERDALAAEVERLRKALERVEREGKVHAHPLDKGLKAEGILISWGAAMQCREALSPQPPTASPSAPEGVSGDSERTCVTCRWCALSCSGMRYVEPSACSGCYEVPEHPHWEARP